MSDSDNKNLPNQEIPDSFLNKAKGALASATDHAKGIASVTKEGISQTAKKTSALAMRTAELVGDLNGDGKVNDEDLKIAVAKCKEITKAVADEAGVLAKEVAKSDLVKDVASGAAVGAVLAVPVPLVGPATGAVVGGVMGAYKNFNKKK